MLSRNLSGRIVGVLTLSGLLCVPCFPLLAQQVECLANISTGFDQDADVAILEGEVDDDYEVDSGFGFESAFIVSHPAWLANTDESGWISSSPDTNAEPGDHIFEISFELPDDIDTSRVAIVGTWAIDNSIADVVIITDDAVKSTGISGIGGFGSWFDFPSDDTLGFFEGGSNTIQFVVTNAPGDPPAPNPLGLRVNACVALIASQKRSLDLSTGFDDAMPDLIAPGNPDPDYILVGPDGSGIGPAPATVAADGCGGGLWLPPRINSRWISLDDNTCEGPEGEYVYRTEINLPDDFEVDRAVIKGAGIAMDDELVDVLINEEPTGFSTFGSDAFQGFPVDFGRGLFVTGSNLIEFVVNNAGGATGLHIDAQVGLGAPEPDVEPSLFSLDTGFDNETGDVIANDEGDDNWVVIGPPGSDIGPVPATVVSDAAWPISDGTWWGTTERSKWIGVQGTSSNGPPGVYTFRIIVEIPDGIDASLARIIATATSDNGANDIIINGTPTGVGVTGAFNTFPALPADIGLGLFENGENVVEFLVNNAGDADNPVGLRVEGVVGIGTEDPNDLSSGIGARGVGPLPGGVEDPRYTVTGPAGSGIGPRAAVALTEGRIPIPPWVGNTDTSRWIGLDGADSVGPAGNYEYELRFQLGAESPSKASLNGSWAAAGQGVDVELNGTSLGLSAGPNELTPFPARAGKGLFLPGENTLVFIVSHPSEGPTGLHVSARAEGVPEANPLDISTGFDQDEGAVLEDEGLDFVFDDDYTYTTPDFIEETSVLVFEDGYPIPPWIANSATSRWIGVPDPDSNGSPGEYRFETFVELTANQAEDAVLVGSWSVDNGGIDVVINDVSTGIASGGFTTWTPFPEDAGLGLFQEGSNSIVFVITNAPGDPPADNPVGLRVDAVVDVGETAPGRAQFRRADTNDAGGVSITSAIFILNYLFTDEVDTLPCEEAADVDNDGSINLTDAVNILDYLFGGPAPPPAAPGAENCGEDPDPPGSLGDLGCESYTSC